MKERLPPWTPFLLADNEPLPTDEYIASQAQATGHTFEEYKKALTDIQKDTVVVNSRYQVNLRRFPGKRGFPETISLSIKRRDKERVGKERYRDFLRIKNELVGPEHEAFELYPAMERNVDTANQYYLWVFSDPTVRVPVGFREGKMENTPVGFQSSKNEPFNEEDLKWQPK